MKRFFLSLICLVTTYTLHAQTNFGNCRDHLNRPLDDQASIEKMLEASDSILNNLIGLHAPDFKVKSIMGKEFHLKELEGKVVVLNFWFTSCAPCIAETPALNKLVDAYKNQDVVFIAFGKQDAESLIEHNKKHKFNYNHVASTQEFADKYCIIGGWPTNMVLDKKGILRQVFSGGYTDERAATAAYDKMKPTIDKYLSKK
jgi:peroxiredoxin